MLTKVLSIDGGGVRGLLPAYWLREMQNGFETPLRDRFDVFAGTSTGSLVAAALALPDVSLDQLNLCYKNDAKQIFPGWCWEQLWRSPFTASGWWPKYSGRGLRQVIENVFPRNGKTKLGDVDASGKRLLVVAFDGYNRGPRVFDSRDTATQHISVAEVCRVSCAAPSYFPAQLLEGDPSSVPYIDGGVAANNPSALAVSRLAGEGVDLRHVVLVSLGTGDTVQSIEAKRERKQLGSRGWMRWAKPIIGMLMEGNSVAAHHVSRALLSDHYFRIQHHLGKKLDRLDNAAKGNLESLAQEARKFWAEYSETREYERLRSLLLEDGGHRYAGIWRSDFTWSEEQSLTPPCGGVAFTGKAEGAVVEVEQIGNHLRGRTVEGEDAGYPFTFEADIDDGGFVLGSHRSTVKELSGTFLLRYNRVTGDLSGFWTGMGDQGLYVGTWTLNRK